jgi:hypothetical protein
MQVTKRVVVGAGCTYEYVVADTSAGDNACSTDAVLPDHKVVADIETCRSRCNAKGAAYMQFSESKYCACYTDACTLTRPPSDFISPAVVYSCTPPESWCGKGWKSRDFSKCDYFGDPHFTKHYAGGSRFDVMGLGPFMVAGSKSGTFEVQNFHCPFGRKPTNTLTVATAIRIGGNTVVLSVDGSLSGLLWLNGAATKTEDLQAAGFKVGGAFQKGEPGLQIMSGDCRYRVLSKHVIRGDSVAPGFAFNNLIRVPLEDTNYTDGICNGCDYQKALSAQDLLFTDEQLDTICNHCIEKPRICDADRYKPPTPVPVEERCNKPPPPCEDTTRPDGCGYEAAEEHCAALKGTPCFEGCEFDFCASDCQATDMDTEEECNPDPPEPPEPPDTTTVPPPSTTLVPPTTTSEPPATITDDPHIRNLAQESFAVNRPGDYVFLRLPLDPSRPAILEVRGSIEAFAGAPCKMYTAGVSISGAWLGDKTVHVRPLKRSEAGSNTAGKEVSPLSLLVTAREQPDLGAEWTSFENLSAARPPGGNLGLPDTFMVMAFNDPAFWKMREGETFQFMVGIASDPALRAKINVAQASHQALNVALHQAKQLGTMRLGGLVGTEAHDTAVEALTDECKDWKASGSHAEGSMSLTSLMNASWRPSVIYSSWS